MCSPSDRVLESWRRESKIEYLTNLVNRPTAERYVDLFGHWEQLWNRAIELTLLNDRREDE